MIQYPLRSDRHIPFFCYHGDALVLSLSLSLSLSFTHSLTHFLTLSLSPAAGPASIVFDPDASCYMAGKVESELRGEDKERVGG
jgi:hypothetical protein